MPKINARRLLGDLHQLSLFGANNPGVIRPAFSQADIEARKWLKKQYEEAGLEAYLDGVGNVLGRSRQKGPALLIGSHSDSQPTGGWLDGALGVIYGLETARAFAEDPKTQRFAIDAVSWQDEESRFFSSLGSRSFCGKIPPGTLKDLRDKQGISLDQARKEAGLLNVPMFTVEKDRYLGYLEGHIEQGPQLELEEKRIGVVSSIVGLRGSVFKFTGQQNHAGTTMMNIRKDASAALYALANSINEEFPKVAGDRSVWTMGRVSIHPGAPSIVPGTAELELQYRDASTDILDAFAITEQRLIRKINERGGARVENISSRDPIHPSLMHPNFVKNLELAAEGNIPGKWLTMPSGAYHDAGVLQEVMPSGMLFIPSIGGISHDFAENSHEEDIVLGCQVLADAAASLMKYGLS